MASTMVMVAICMFVLAVVAFALCPRLVKNPVTPTLVLNVFIYVESVNIECMPVLQTGHN